MKFENLPLSFNPKVLFITQQDNGWQYLIHADGKQIGWLINRNGIDVAHDDGVNLTNDDREFFINAVNISLKKPPQEASNIFHSIMKSSVIPIKAKCPICGAKAKKINTEEFECVNGHNFVQKA